VGGIGIEKDRSLEDSPETDLHISGQLIFFFFCRSINREKIVLTNCTKTIVYPYEKK
jgi:hypothetical protein